MNNNLTKPYIPSVNVSWRYKRTRGRVIINSHSRELNITRCNYTWVMYDNV